MGSFARLSGGVTAAAIAGIAAVAAPSAAMAAPSSSVNLPCSVSALVTAINQANAGTGPTTIVLQRNCNYSVSVPAVAGTAFPTITGNVTLSGGTGTVLSRSAFTILSFRILDVAATGTLNVSGVTIRNGSSLLNGGGIRNAGVLSVSSSTLTDNTAANGGAVANSAGGTATITSSLLNENTTTGVGGGGIMNFGLLTVAKSNILTNTAPINGGGVNTQPGGVSNINQTSVNNNTSGGAGGGLSNLGTTNLTGSQVRRNTAGAPGGGIASGNTNVSIVNTIIRDNSPDDCSPSTICP
jgi:hypothetical protein